MSNFHDSRSSERLASDGGGGGGNIHWRQQPSSQSRNEQTNGSYNQQTYSNGYRGSGREESYHNGREFQSSNDGNPTRRNSHRHDERGGGGGGVDLYQYTRNDTRRNDNEGWETVPNSHSHRQQSHRGERRQVQHYRTHSSQSFMLMLVGIPGSGKSTLAKALESSAPHVFVRINQDALGNRRRCEHLTRQTLEQGKVPIIDRCDFNTSQRRYFVEIAREFQVPVDCISLELPKETCVRRCQVRENHETIERGQELQVVNKMMSMFEAPMRQEGFRRVERTSRPEQINDIMAEYMSMVGTSR